MLSTAGHWSVFEYHASACLKNISIFSSILIASNMVLCMNDGYTSYHHSQWVKCRAIFSSYLGVLCWVCATIISGFNNLWRATCSLYYEVLSQGVGNMHAGIQHHHIMAITDVIDAASPFVASAYPYS